MRSNICRVIAALLVTSTAASAAVTVNNGWFRALPAAVPSGGYFTLHNAGNRTVTLTEVESSACGMLMMHKSGNGGMAHVMSLDVAAGSTIAFSPGGYHLMCMQARLTPGTKVPVTLSFSDGTSVTVPFDVRNAVGK